MRGGGTGRPGLHRRRPRPARSGSGGGPPLGIFAGARSGRLGRPMAVFAVTAVGAGSSSPFCHWPWRRAAPAWSPPRSSCNRPPRPRPAGSPVGTPTAAEPPGWSYRAGRLGRRHPRRRPHRRPRRGHRGAAVFGVGFGITQSATITLMYARVPVSGYGTVSALWNVAYDGGMGVGAVGFGTVAGLTGYPWAFALTALLTLTAFVPAWWDRTAARERRTATREDRTVTAERQS
ncbi:hypothetical protein NKH77_49950 [Streptomyces sp. M19]